MKNGEKRQPHHVLRLQVPKHLQQRILYLYITRGLEELGYIEKCLVGPRES